MNEALEKAARLSYWRAPVNPQPLGGGISNTNFTVEHEGEKFVVRIGEDIPVHGVTRVNELAASRAAHAAGLSPEVVHHEPGVLVLRWQEGRTLNPEDVSNPDVLARIVPAVRTCHREIPNHFRGAPPMFWVFQVLREYHARLLEDKSRMLAALPRYMTAARALEEAVGPIDVVFGHNDLLAANLIDDGRKIWIVDWEYGGFNSPLFDLGGLASNNGLSTNQEEWLLETYFELPVNDNLRHRYAAMKCASLLRESMWSMVSEIHSHLEFDYVAYTAENLEHFEAAWREFQVSG